MGSPRTEPRQPRSLTTDDLRKMRGGQVRAMVSTKTSPKAMAEVLGISLTELKREYKKELKDGHDYIYAVLSQKLVTSAAAGDMRAILTWFRQQGGWQEVTRRELTGKNGEPISFTNLDNVALSSIIEALAAQGATRRGKGRNGAAIEGAAGGEIIDLDPLPGTTDEGSEQ